MNKRISITILLLVLTLPPLLVINLSSCDTTEPIDEIEPGRRDYVWSEDTLDVGPNEYITFRDIVGNTPDNVWFGTLDITESYGLWHFDGSKWSPAEFPGFVASALWIFEDNTIWAGTVESKILKMENGQWTETYNLKLNGYDFINIAGIYGKTKNDIYAVGWAIKIIKYGYEVEEKGIVLHYNGTEWKFVNIPDFYHGGFNTITYQEDIDKYFIQGVRNNTGVLDILYIFDGKILNEIMSTYAEIGISKINGQVYINSQKKVYKYIDNKLVLWKDFSGTEFRSSFVGRSETDFFNNSSKGIGHYNGIDYKTIYETYLETQAKVIFKKDIFITSEDYYNHKYIIIHGKLKEY